jgi:nickel transport protein
MKPIKTLLLGLLLPCFLFGHSVYHSVINKGVSVKIFYAEDDPAAYSQYEVFKPNDKIAFTKGRTDRNGVVSFLPDSAGAWKIKVIGESDHGYHGTEVNIKIDENMNMQDFGKAPVEKYQKILAGLGALFGLFGIMAIFRCKKRNV